MLFMQDHKKVVTRFNTIIDSIIETMTGASTPQANYGCTQMHSDRGQVTE